MAGIGSIKSQLHHQVRNWHPDRKCNVHGTPRCTYNEQGEIAQLHLCGLRLARFPSAVLRCSSLQTLGLSSNQLSSLPPALVNLSFLHTLYLDNNPLQEPPPRIVVQGLPAILTYLRAAYVKQQQQQQQRLLRQREPQIHDQLGEEDSDLFDSFESLAEAKKSVQKNVMSQIPFAAAKEQPSMPTPLRVPAVSAPTRPITIFYCYAHEDKDLRDRIDKHLGVLKRLGQVVDWHDREIRAGTEWEREIETHLSTASIILLLVSADFVNSDYCYGVEMQKALEMHEKGLACVLPILVRPVDWQDAPFAKLQLLPTGAKPITRWSDPEEALEDVARQIRAVVTTLRTQQG
jgi:TIR domain